MPLRRIGARAVLLGCTAMVVTCAAAFACTNLATLNLSSTAGRPGEAVTVSGSSFRMPANVTTGIQIKWNGTDGQVLSEVRPDRAGNFTTQLTVPDGAPGYYVVTAVLRDAKGLDTSGTPARASFQVLGSPGRPLPDQAVAPATATPSSGPSSNVPLALVIGLGVLGLALFAGGFAAVARTRGAAPTPAAVRRD